jgi:hypothetical protein
MLCYEVVVDETVLAAFEQRSHAEKWGSRCVDQDEVRAVGAPDWQKLTYLVFERHQLVAAFAKRDDAEHWIEECGNHSMKLHEIGAPTGARPPKRERPDKSSDKAGAPVSRKR